jgi:branched-chain amino acid transport system substrate-binding protein
MKTGWALSRALGTRRRVAITGVAGLLVCAAAVTPSASSGASSKPINVAEIVSLTGSDASLGVGEKADFAATVKFFNSQGGIGGRKLNIVVYDDKSDPATGLAEARTVAANKSISAVIWGSSGPAAETIVPYFMKVKMPVIEYEYPSFFLDIKNYPTYWTTAPASGEQAQDIANFLKGKGSKNIGIMSDGTPFGVEFSGLLQKDLNSDHISNTVYTYSATSLDITSTLTKMQEAGIKTIAPVGELDVNEIFTGLTQNGWSPNIVGNAVLGDYAPAIPAAQQPTTYFSCQYQAKSSSFTAPSVESQLLTVLGKVSGVSGATVNLLGNYDALLVLKAAILKAGSATPTAIDQAMQSLKNVKSAAPGITYSFNKYNHDGWPLKSLGICALSPTVAPYDIPIQVAAS